METVALIKKISQMAVDDAGAISAGRQNPVMTKFKWRDFPWNEVADCMQAELRIRKHLYPDVQFEHISGFVKETFDTVLQDISIDNVIHAMEKLADMLEFLPDTDYTCAKYEEANFAKAYWHHQRHRTVIVLGDSHVNFFSGAELLDFIPIGHDVNTCPIISEQRFTPLHVGPCLAYNVDNPTSSYNSMKKTEWLCDNFIVPGSTVVCSFGEIDIRVHALKQAQIRNVAVQTVIDDILVHYCTLLTRLKLMGYKVWCWGPIATQRDSNEQDELFPHYGCEQDRNRATEYFNTALKNWCDSNEVGFMSIFNLMVDADFMTRVEYLSADGCHLGQRARMLAQVEWDKLFGDENEG